MDPFETNNLSGKMEFKAILEKMRVDCEKIEIENTSSDKTFQPVFPVSVNILDWVKYKHTLDYMNMLNGKEIGFHKYLQMYHE